MTLQRAPGALHGPYLFPEPRPITIPPAYASPTSLSAANHKYCSAGFLTHQSAPGTALTLTKVHFMCGTITTVLGLTNIRVGVQGVNTGTTAIRRADGTYLAAGLGFVDTLITGFTSDTWFTSATLNTTGVSVTSGQAISAVAEITSLSASESFIIKGVARTAEVFNRPAAGVLARATAGTAYAGTNISGSFLFEFSDGSFGSIKSCWPAAAVNTVTFTNATASTEYGVIINLPYKANLVGLWCMANLAASATGTFTFYTDPLGTPAASAKTYGIDVAQTSGAASVTYFEDFFTGAPLTLAINTNYCLALSATSANNILLYSTSCNAVGNLDSLAGQNFRMVSRASGAFANVNSGLDYPIMGVILQSLDDATGGVATTTPHRRGR